MIKSMSAGNAPGQLTRGTRMNNTNTYVPGGNGSRQETVWSIARATTPPAATNITITFNVTMGCNTDEPFPFTAVFPYTGQTGSALINAIIAALNGNPNIAALGTWTNDGGSLKFVSAFPGVNTAVEFVYDPAQFTISQTTNLAGGGIGHYRFKGGTAAHYVPGEAQGVSERRTLYPPTQDPSDGGTTQEFAGIVLACDMHEMSLPTPTYPNFSNCNTDCLPPPSCYRVLNSAHAPVTIALETPHQNGAGGQLHYRIAPDITAPISGTELGVFRFGTADGCIPVPFDYEIISFDFGALSVEIELK